MTPRLTFLSIAVTTILAASEAATSGPPASDLSDPVEKAAWQTANQAAEKISSLYYRSFDKQGRSDLPTFFVESVTLIWNGNQVVGRQAVVDFLTTKLPKSQTTVHTISAQPVQKVLSGDNTVVMVNTLGSMKFEGNPTKMFAETFFLIKDGNLWRIQSATFRFIE
ncbi:NTF2 export protein 2 [Echinococcus multilocularis]|uniref:NTF2 export protein 2 n=1 Tax=Echinococcus multilocularis TaxID=6211 RepID=A0A068YG62_ECHMU|nr:NTF2 export protein 2 [Echinococcus multilocularis]